MIAEALTNVSKHAAASSVDVRVEADAGTLRIEISDDGAGGADPRLGTGLTGLLDRVEAAEGSLEVRSPAGGGTTLRVVLPLGDQAR